MTVDLRSRGTTFVESDSPMHYLCVNLVHEAAETLSHTVGGNIWGLVGGPLSQQVLHLPHQGCLGTQSLHEHLSKQDSHYFRKQSRPLLDSCYCWAILYDSGLKFVLHHFPGPWPLEQDKNRAIQLHIIFLRVEEPIQITPHPYWGRRHLNILVPLPRSCQPWCNFWGSITCQVLFESLRYIFLVLITTLYCVHYFWDRDTKRDNENVE